MASNYTENYGLCQWEATDQVLREEFNENNKKVDTVLGILSQTVAQHSEAIAGFGNCRLYFATYTGNGALSRTYTFPAPPVMVFRQGPRFISIMVKGSPDAFNYHSAENWGGTATWNGNSMTITYTNTEIGGGNYKSGNQSGTTYYMVALMDAEN